MHNKLSTKLIASIASICLITSPMMTYTVRAESNPLEQQTSSKLVLQNYETNKNGAYSLEWVPVTNATHYIVEISSYDGSYSKTEDVTSTTYTTLLDTVNVSDEPNHYIFSIQALDENEATLSTLEIKDEVELNLPKDGLTAGESFHFNILNSYPSTSKIQSIIDTSSGQYTVDYVYNKETKLFEATYSLPEGTVAVNSIKTVIKNVFGSQLAVNTYKLDETIEGNLEIETENLNTNFLYIFEAVDTVSGEIYKASADDNGVVNVRHLPDGIYKVSANIYGGADQPVRKFSYPEDIQIQQGYVKNIAFTLPLAPSIEFALPSQSTINTPSFSLEADVTDYTSIKATMNDEPLDLTIVDDHLSIPMENLQDGKYQIDFTVANDTFSQTIPYTFNVDTTPPNPLSISESIENGALTVNWKLTNDISSMAFKVYDSKQNVLLEDTELTNSFTLDNVIGGEIYYFEYTLTDAYGNTTAPVKISIDVEGPDFSFIPSTTDVVTREKELGINYKQSNNERIIATFYYNDEEVESTELDPSIEEGYIPIEASSDGQYKVVFNVLKNGTTKAFEHTFMVQTEHLPDIENFMATVQDDGMLFTWDALQLAKRYEFYVNGAPFDVIYNPNSSYFFTNYSKNRDYTIQLYAYDYFNEVSKSIVLTLESTTPRLTVLSAIPELIYEKSVDFNASVTSNTEAIAIIQKDKKIISTTKLPVKNNKISTKLTFPTDGEYKVSVIASKNNVNATENFNVSVHTEAPEPVENVEFIAVDETMKLLSWTHPNEEVISNYIVEVYDENMELLSSNETENSYYSINYEEMDEEQPLKYYKIYAVDKAKLQSAPVIINSLGEIIENGEEVIIDLDDIVLNDEGNYEITHDNLIAGQPIDTILPLEVLKQLVDDEAGLVIHYGDFTIKLTPEQLKKLYDEIVEKELDHLTIHTLAEDTDLESLTPIVSVSLYGTETPSEDSKLDFNEAIAAEMKGFEDVDNNGRTLTTLEFDPATNTTGYLFNREKDGILTFDLKPDQSFIVANNQADFNDVARDRWSAPYIYSLAAKQIIKGSNTEGTLFSPENNITRAEFASLIARLLNLPKQPYQGTFTDVPESHWGYKEVEAAAAVGIVTGVGDNKFDLNAKITREQMITMIARAIQYKTPSLLEDMPPSKSFKDDNKISAYAVENVKIGTAFSIIDGIDQNGVKYFQPLNSATREQAAKMLYVLLEIL